MAGPSIAVLADDLTGAAEIAAIGNRHGLPARIFASNAQIRDNVATGLSVHDTDSRLLSHADAARRITDAARQLTSDSPGLVFKKTDSVLRGNVVAESIALARALGRRRILLVPANPSLGRTIIKGQYLVNGQPLHETAFARDPHHPAKSARVTDLLDSSPDWPVISVSPHDSLPDHGLIVGDATSTADLVHWAACVDAHTLPAGGAEFFQAGLKKTGLAPQPTAPLQFSGPALVITGALTPAREALLAHAAASHWPVHTLTQNDIPLPTANLVLIQTPKIALDDHATSERLRQHFGALVRAHLSQTPLGHLVVEGGATAAAISDANGWTTFDVAGEWAPGVIALRPTLAPQLLFSIKPGSYAWPENLWRLLDSCLVPAAKS